MTLEELLRLVGRLNAQSEALAALGALLRVRGEGLAADLGVEQRLEEVAALLGADLSGLDRDELTIAA